MRLKIGMPAPEFKLTDLDGHTITSEEMKGQRFMLSFYRYASCPFCNLRVSFLQELHKTLDLEHQFIGVFQSSNKDMLDNVGKQNSVFPICSDEKRSYYKKYGVEKSSFGYILGALKLNKLRTAIKRGFKIGKSMGPKTTIPADFLVDEMGIIQIAYYGKDISDHLDLAIVEEFFK